jgi:hypothetical protein
VPGTEPGTEPGTAPGTKREANGRGEATCWIPL